jgi:hypothetical protein
VRFAWLRWHYPPALAQTGDSGISFITNVVRKLGAEFQPALRDQLAETFLDSRYQIVQAVNSGVSDPVPQLFTDTWKRLSPIMKQAIPGISQQTADQYTSFIRAMDAATSFSGIGQSLGLFRITPDTLRGSARLLGAGGADPLAYVLDVDAGLRELLGFTGSPPAFRPSPALEQGYTPDRLANFFIMRNRLRARLATVVRIWRGCIDNSSDRETPPKLPRTTAYYSHRHGELSAISCVEQP